MGLGLPRTNGIHRAQAQYDHGYHEMFQIWAGQIDDVRPFYIVILNTREFVSLVLEIIFHIDV